MKKIIVSLLCIGCIGFIMISCGSSRQATALSTLNGEWNIVEINGTAVQPATGNQLPSIGFDTSTGRIYGNSGCNRMMGSFDNTVKAGTINLGEVATTRMYCPDMTMEQNVINTLKNVRGYRKMSNNRIALTNSMNRPVMILTTKVDLSVIPSLEGEWKITEAKGQVIPTGLERQPFLAFDTTKKSIHGNAGCNMLNGGFTTEVNNPRAIAFPAVAATMMACPDMSIERKVMDALNEVKSFSILTDKTAALYDENGNMVMSLMK